jgi:periplasmic divalent cation tolerance protein
VRKASRRSASRASETCVEPAVLVVVTTVGTEEQALDIAHALVAAHLAACVNIVPRIRSVFFWKGKVNDDGEWMLFIKTAPGNFEPVKNAIRRLHAYEIPEILGFPAIHADALFAKWVIDFSTPRQRTTRRKKPGKGAKRRSGG